MSNIYINEPPTEGKVLLKTTVGDIEIELWSNEAPLACKNFVQLCMEGYYEGTIFHRVIRDFIAQGGDPMGTGESHGDSIYGKSFKDEFHSRLRFERRGLVAMANSAKNDNTSHFFFTLGAAKELNNKHTIFGKVGGDTLYNMLKLNEIETDSNDRPIYTQKIIKTKVILNPFNDIVPRVKEEKVKGTEKEDKPKVHSKAVKNFSLLSFGDEAREDEEEVVKVTEKLQSKGKSAHELLDDKNLSSVPAVMFDDEEDDEEKVRAEKEVMMGTIRNKLKRKLDEGTEIEGKKKKKQIVDQKKDESDDDDESLTLKNTTQDRIKKLREESKKIIKDLKGGNTSRSKKDHDNDSSSTSRLQRDSEAFEDKRATILSKNPNREAETLEMLQRFKKKLMAAKRLTEYDDDDDDDDEQENDDDENEDDEKTNRDVSWMTHELRFTENMSKVLDANVADSERYEIYDPRNPITERRRKESSKKVKKLK